MNPCYITIFVIGMLLIIICIGLIIFDRKRYFEFIKLADEKEQQLRDIISDAELMIDELNSLSDYIVNQIETKNLEFKDNIESYQNEIININQKAENLQEILNNVCSNLEMQKGKIIHTKDKDKLDKDKFISSNSKYSEVIRLSNEGVEETEIARQLNMGKAEVQLVLQFTK